MPVLSAKFEAFPLLSSYLMRWLTHVTYGYITSLTELLVALSFVFVTVHNLASIIA